MPVKDGLGSDSIMVQSKYTQNRVSFLTVSMKTPVEQGLPQRYQETHVINLPPFCLVSQQLVLPFEKSPSFDYVKPIIKLCIIYCIHTETVKPALSKPVYISTNQITGFVRLTNQKVVSETWFSLSWFNLQCEWGNTAIKP